VGVVRIGVLFCDQVGSTAILTSLGDELNEELRRDYFAALRHSASMTHGEVVKGSGDGLMVIFRNGVDDALACGELMHRSIDRLGRRDLCAGLALRVGVTFGDAVYERGDWYGSEVNLAARLCAAAAPGELLVSDDALVRSACPAERRTQTDELTLKGFPDPVSTARVEWHAKSNTQAPLPPELDADGAYGFVGRLEPMSVLAHAWSAARDGERRLVFVEGEAGAGTTRLLAEFAATVAAEAIVLYGQCGRDTTALKQSIRWYAGSETVAQLGNDTHDVAAAIGGAVPLVALRTGVKPSASSERLPLLAAAEVMLGRASARHPLLIVLDAVDLADEAELQEVAAFASSPVPARCLVVLGYRAEARGARELRDKLEGTPGSSAIELAPMSRRDVYELIAREAPALVGGELDALVELTMSETAGNARDVAGVITELHHVQHPHDAAQAVIRACPFMGLRAYESDDRTRFCGRDRLADEIAGRAWRNRFTVVVGGSGSGKSSLVRAGVLPRLLSDDPTARTIIVTPTPHPIESLSRAISPTQPEEWRQRLLEDPACIRFALGDPRVPTVLVVDQLEECFTLCADEIDRASFLDSITAAAVENVCVLATLRGDLYGRGAEHAGLASALQEGTVLLGPMQRAEMREAIEQPAALARLGLERGLTEILLEDVVARPGSLPLLSHALLETWRRRRDDTLTIEAYREAGGATGAIAKTADRVFEQLNDRGQRMVRLLCLRLTALGEGTDDSRRRVARHDLLDVGSDREEAQSVLDRLIAARLVTTDDGTVELAHEALLREWPRLRSWLDEDREQLQVRAHLDRAARDWGASGQSDSELYRGIRLEAAAELDRTELNDRERRFIDASVFQHARETSAQRRRNRRLRGALAATAVLLMAALLAGGIAFSQRASADRNAARARQTRDESEYQLLIARSRDLKHRDRQLALLLAVEARQERDNAQSRGALQAALLDEPRFLGSIIDTSHPDTATAMCTLGTGSIVLSGGADHTVGFADVAQRQPLGPRLRLTDVPGAPSDPDNGIRCAASADGSTAVVADRNGAVWTIDARTRTLSGEPFNLRHQVNEVAMSPDGKLAVFGTYVGRTIIVALDGAAAPRELPSGDDTVGVAFSADAATLATTTRDQITFWDTATWTPRTVIDDAPSDQTGGLAPAPENDRYLQFSSNGQWLVDTRRNVVRLYDARTGGLKWETITGAVDGVNAVFAPDGDSIFFQTTDGVIQQHDGATGQAVAIPMASADESFAPRAVLALNVINRLPPFAVMPDGATLITASSGGSAVGLWALDGRSAISTPIASAGQAPRGYSPDGTSLMTAASTSSPITFAGQVWDVPSGGELASFPTAAYPRLLDARRLGGFFIDELAVDRENLNTGVRDGPRFFLPVNDVVQAAADNTDILVGRPDGSIRRYQADGHQVGDPWLVVDGAPYLITIDPEADLALVATPISTGVYRLSDASLAYTLPTDSAFAGFGADGSLLATSSSGNSVVIRDARTGEAVGDAFSTSGGFEAIEIGGRSSVVLESPTAAQMYDLDSRQPVGDPFPSLDKPFLRQDGLELATSDRHGVTLWNLDPDRWERAACEIASRNLTHAEWDTYFPNAGGYHATCPQWPIP
jgi:class 3 adenylate cyclase/WD40 repeat protein